MTEPLRSAGPGTDVSAPSAERVEYYHETGAPVANDIRVSVCAFVRDAGGALLLIRRRDNALYTLPGGLQQVGETLSHGAVREVKEETGVNVEVTGLIGIYSDPEYVIAYPEGTVAQEFSVCFRAQAYGGRVRVSSESSEVHWVHPDDLDALPISAAVLLRIRHGLAHTGEPHYT